MYRQNLRLLLDRLVRYFVCFLTIVLADSVAAQSVRPMIYDMQPFGVNSRKSLIVENTKQHNMTIEVVANEIKFDQQKGQSVSTDEGSFIIFPPTAVIEPGATQVIQVQYVADPDIEESKSYYLSVQQLPIDLPENSDSSVGVVVHFNTIANVVPIGAEAVPVVGEVTNSDQDEFWNVKIRNDGNRYLGLANTEWSVRGENGTTLKLHGRDIAKLNNSSIIFPNSLRSIRIPAQDGIQASNADVKITQNN